MGQLTVTFQGVCTHFSQGVVAGVPHRVVLPDASAFRFGMLDIGNEPSPAPYTYFLTPHLPSLRTNAGDQERLTIPGLLTKGSLLNGIRIQVANCIDTAVDYKHYHKYVSSLTTFVERYEWSPEVVLGGRAACYFDIFGGEIKAFTEPDRASYVTATFRTPYGEPPALRITPLLPSDPGVINGALIPLHGDGAPGDPSVQLVVSNMSADCHHIGHQKDYDYLLHYLTARGGIPRMLTQSTPGLAHPKSITPLELTAVLGQMELTHVPHGVKPLPPTNETELLAVPNPYEQILITTAACSNSGYP